MRVFGSLVHVRGLALLSAFSHIGALAGPSINVALRASFNSAPYLVELLETAAEENSTAYFPLLDRIAEGSFLDATTDEQLFTAFIDLLKSDGHITDPATLSSFKFALSVRSAAPRIEAHYQFYNTSVEPSLQTDQDVDCETWVAFSGKQYCDPELKESHGSIKGERTNELPFDTILGNNTHALPSILYADVTSPSFAKFHKTLRKTAAGGKTSYRVRHKPSTNSLKSPLIVNGYGVSLQLKRTDYIVMDDRQAEQGEKAAAQKPLDTELHDEEVSDLKPLSKDDITHLSVKAASFVMKSEHPMDTLLKLIQDFPKYSSAIVAHNASDEFVKEQEWNVQQIPGHYQFGSSIFWINGVQLPMRDINPFALLEHLRRERKLIHGVRSLGLSGPDAISLLSHSAITETQSEAEPQRYDFRDDIEGGNIIVWLNDIEKDGMYESWPTTLQALLQRTYPGSLPSVRRDIHNAILPVDFSSAEDVSSTVEPALNIMQRGVPLRWGFVPSTRTAAATEQAKVVYYLLDTYGVSAVTKYLATSVESKKLEHPDKSIFELVIGEAEVLADRETLALADVLKSEEVAKRIEGAKNYLDRLEANEPSAPLFINGVPIAKADNWLGMLSQRVSMDLNQIQRGVFERAFEEDTWVPKFFLFQAMTKRNSLIVPENEKSIALVNMVDFEDNHGEAFKKMPRIEPAGSASKAEWAHLTLLADFDSESGLLLLKSVAQYREDNPNVEVVLIHNPQTAAEKVSVSEGILETWVKSGHEIKSEQLLDILGRELVQSSNTANSSAFWAAARHIYEAFELQPGQQGILVNGRFVGPIPVDKGFSKDDVEMLVSYETNKRIQPLSQALEALKLTEKVASPFDVAKIQSLVTLSTISTVPEGFYESASTLRVEHFKKWNQTHTTITKGDIDTATFQIVASIDPATELAQRWVPILKTLSDMDGVHLQLFLNPKQALQELPVKRFYRYLLDSKPAFTSDGSVDNLKARFSGIPKEALLNLAMDVPPAWLVAPEESIHDLDNVKLSSLPSGTNIDAIYGLESILIEGHSRDTTNGGQPPRGAEVVLATEKDPHFADTIIMANLGYFQFKANPGFYNIRLKGGRSQEVFTLDSAGGRGWALAPGDETSEIVLMSFQGTTLFPRLSRKPGQETVDVLAPDESLASELVGKGTQQVNKLFNRMGLKFNSEKVLKKGAELLSGGKSTAAQRKQADINIFSVASGHLYERMLNIMMLSVTKHTKNTVKFWFIEQFLSPSFKSFLPHMAAEYGFDYEMVTYKWPHWLRQQSEKQREIWGYKILFLDVLFPLDLDKVIFVDADQIVRTDMMDLVNFDLEGAPYGFTPMCDSRTSMEGFRFWKTGYWANFLRGRPYHISALYVVDLVRFRALAAGDRLRQQYHSLSADPNSLSNLDQDLPNNMQFNLEIKSLPQEWLWCETWCSDESLKEARTIDLCNNPQTKEPKLERARRQVPEWNVYDAEIAALASRVRGEEGEAEKIIDIQELEQVKEREQKVKEAEAEAEKLKEKEKERVKDEL
ncbi:UDP-glucose:glyco protein glucosyltransferas-like protein [Massarina eburnea CBS 473.64]|uniref:UDP-glucose:glyco protein glucosyltransferas-like protein n=1 Tax=Massarina eburnea CBS 473.64 TaxID=1395130 RepID=A0A6A6RG53_9PLEO|nr:UDP-glucose:glyco protein glucosyltransferas-like protein [Massarina eburnea CBS 473.64]